ncbi:MAG: sigma-54 dependent transcriptional regulator [Ignavibacteriaceae bacterium]|nr:sigma-54 dependent transcriptional regulator [Ignavibacteriaceae bacterium]
MMTVEEFKNKYGIIGKSKEIRELVGIIMQVASSDISVLIYGESGTGKEVFAKAIHEYSSRSAKQFLSINCGAIPEGLLESELFGHKKGSFTGAFDNRKGYFEIADEGTLFLDEIGDMPLTTQVRLLRAIETNEFLKIGAETTTKVDVRIIAATNKDLQQEVEAKRFREDLYFRLKAVTLSIPPLRKRKSDIDELAHYFIANFCASGKIEIPLLTQDAIEYLKNYDWPGNVRELKNAVESAVALNKNGILDVQAFIPLITNPNGNSASRNLPIHLNRSPEELDRELMYRALFEIKKDIMELKDMIYQQRVVVDDPKNNNDNEEVLPLEQLEKEAIKNALDQTKGNKRNAAKMLKISERTLYRKIKEYEL